MQLIDADVSVDRASLERAVMSRLLTTVHEMAAEEEADLPVIEVRVTIDGTASDFTVFYMSVVRSGLNGVVLVRPLIEDDKLQFVFINIDTEGPCAQNRLYVTQPLSIIDDMNLTLLRNLTQELYN